MPSTAPSATSSERMWMPACTRLCAVSSAIDQAIGEIGSA